MSSRDTIRILVAIIGAAGLIIAALITGIFALLVEQTKTNANATNVAATYIAQRTVDAPLPQQSYAPQPTFTRLPTYTPYPTPKPNATVVTPKPFIVTATPSADQQDPPPGSTILAGQNYTRNGILVSLMKKFEPGTCWSGAGFWIYLNVENASGEQIVILWKRSLIHVQDDKGKIYRQTGEDDPSFDKNQQFTISSGDSTQMGPAGCSSGSFNWFLGAFDPTTKYFLVTVDQIAGMKQLKWRYDLQK